VSLLFVYLFLFLVSAYKGVVAYVEAYIIRNTVLSF